jgi:hypothetical protein
MSAPVQHDSTAPPQTSEKTMSLAIDPTRYLVVPRLTAMNGPNLVNSLLSARLKEAPDAVNIRADRMERSAEMISRAMADRRQEQVNAPATATVFPVDQRLDSAWGALFRRLEAWSMLPEALGPEVARATTLMARLFPGGLGFTKFAFRQEWAQSETILKLIDAEKLEGEIRELAGAAFLPEIKDAHAAYKKMLDSGPKGATNPEVNLNDALRRLGSEISDYALHVIATADEARPETIEAVYGALKPIDDLRNDNGKKKAAK